ncbi:MipA/OmpV family protein [Luteibacter sp. 22Crub2.1]|uniref:MipA/OmpV family protein n=1 Tax=Luteibacter sp. 22Crub2.1 TaxID=1283288 RepID=UPI0009A8EA5E|nr:MipA/OmpV family protein [Luteibacter sp. 22Crub2.1]SKB74125.1 Outer membrane scaffolding protein for murein synthesis, MipA/OmpV family [Luteibacter sp. 22Crub2.1]
MNPFRPSHAAWVITSLGLVTVSPLASAQDHASTTPATDPNALQAAVGVVAVNAPRYAGSDRDRVQFISAASVSKGPWFADTLRGIGAQYQTESGFSISEAFHYDFGRVERDSNLRPGSKSLRGMGDVPGSIVSRTVVAQQLNRLLSTSAEAEYSLRNGTRRARYRAGAQFGLIQQDADILTFNIDVHGGNAAFNRAYFGVSAAQSARTRFVAYRASGGLYAYSGSLNWTHVFSPHWSSNVIVSGARYIGQIDDSPIVARRTALTSAVAMNYSF